MLPRDEDWTGGILDNASLRAAILFARNWHASTWAVSTLPRDLRAAVTTYTEEPTSLGAAIVLGRQRGIALNDRLVGTRGYVPVLAHECGHLFQPSGTVGLCRSTIQVSKREREAWWIASILAVPLESVRTVRLWGDDPSAVARHLELPRPMVSIRKCIALIFDELAPERNAYPRVMLETATLAMQLWIARFSERLAGRT